MVTTAVEIEGWVASMRQEIAIEPPAPGDIRTPDQIVFELERADAVAARALYVVKEADKVRARTAEQLVKATAQAELAATGSTAAVRAAFVKNSVAEVRAEAELAKVSYRYAQGLAALLDSRKSSLQTQAKLVLATYQLAGIGRRN